MSEPPFTVTPAEPGDDLPRIWREANAAWAPHHYRHTAEYFLANQRVERPRRLAPFGVRGADGWRAFFNVSAAEETLAFTAAEKPLFGIRVRVGRVNFPGLPGVQDDVQLAELIRQLMDLNPEFDAICLDALDLESPAAKLWREKRRLPGLFPYLAARRVQLHRVLEGGDEAAEGGEKSARKAGKHFQRKIRALATAHGEVEFRDFRAPEQVAEFIRDAGAVVARGWQSRIVGEQLAEPDRPYYEELARQGLFRGLVLYAGGQPLAMLDARRNGAVLALYRTSYDARFSKFSPGLLLLTEAINRARTVDGCRVVDWGFGDAPYKQQFSNRAYPEAQAYYFRDCFRLRAATAALSAYFALYDAAKRAVVKLGLTRMFKRAVRGGEEKESAAAE